MLELEKFEMVNEYKFFFFQGFEWEEKINVRKTRDLNDVCYSKEFIISVTKQNVGNAFNSLGLKSKIKNYASVLLNLGKMMKNYFSKSKTSKSFITKRINNWDNDIVRNEFDLLVQLSNKTAKRFVLEKKDWYLCLNDKSNNTNFDTHYIYHPAWAARILKELNPEIHIDISSSLSFCSIVSAFLPIEFYDYRPASISLSNLKSNHADLTKLFFKDNSIHSLSCMHTVEHIGLGRYGDPIDYDGDLKAINELKRVLTYNRV
jgi:hypothetical protein